MYGFNGYINISSQVLIKLICGEKIVYAQAKWL
jgi:hypothetical protein